MTDAKNAKPRDDGRRASGNHRIGKDRPAHHTGTPPDVGILLSRLEGARKSDKGWTAC